MNRKSLMSSGLDNESTRNKLKELALYDSETNETDLMKTQYFAILMVRENVDSIIDRIRDFREAGAHFFQLNLLHGIHLPPAY